MKKIDCVCQCEDRQFKLALEAMLTYSGLFNVIHGSDDSVTEGQVLTMEVAEDEAIDYDDNPMLLKVSKYISFSELLLSNKIATHIVFDTGSNSYSYSRQQFKEQGSRGHSIKKFGIYSPEGKCGATTISTGIGRMLYRSGYKTLMIDLAPVKLEKDVPANGGVIAKLIYDIKRNRAVDVERYTFRKDGVYILRRDPISKYMNVFDVEVARSIEESAARCGFDVILYDIGNHLDEKNLTLLKRLDSAICVFLSDEVWIRNDMVGLREMLDMGPVKTISILNKVSGQSNVQNELKSEDEDNGIDLAIWNYKNVGERSVDSEFGNQIRILVDKMLGD